jgi:hypothetical protein
MLLRTVTISTTNLATAKGIASATILKWLRTCKALSIIHFWKRVVRGYSEGSK